MNLSYFACEPKLLSGKRKYYPRQCSFIAYYLCHSKHDTENKLIEPVSIRNSMVKFNFEIGLTNNQKILGILLQKAYFCF